MNKQTMEYYRKFKKDYPYLTGLKISFNGMGDEFSIFYDCYFFHTKKMKNFLNISSLPFIEKNTKEISKKDKSKIMSSIHGKEWKEFLLVIIDNDQRICFDDAGCRGTIIIDFNTDRVKVLVEEATIVYEYESVGHMNFLIDDNGIGDDEDLV